MTPRDARNLIRAALLSKNQFEGDAAALRVNHYMGPATTERMFLEELAKLPDDVRAYWYGDCHRCPPGRGM